MKQFIILILIAIYLSSFPVNSTIVPSETLPSPPADWSNPGISSTITSTSTTKQIGAYQETSHDTGTSVYFTSPTPTGSPLEIEKFSSPNSKDGYLVSNPYTVLVEVECLGGRRADNVDIFENVDKNLTINHFYGYYVARYPNETFNTSGHFLEYKPFDKINNTINIAVDNLTSKQILLYKYDITPQKEGIFSAETIIRIGKEYSTQSDLKLSSQIDTREAVPSFDVKVDVKKLKLNKNDLENLTYILEYVGGSTNPCWRPIRFDNDSRELSFSHVGPIDNTFRLHRTKLINATIQYANAGTYSLPGIWIGERYYPFEKQIEVSDSWEFWKNLATIAPIASLPLSIISLIYSDTTLGASIRRRIPGNKPNREDPEEEDTDGSPGSQTE